MIVSGCCTGLTNAGTMPPMKYWEIIADRLHAEGWSYGIAEHFTKHGLLFCVDAHRDGKRFIVKADDLLTAFLSHALALLSVSFMFLPWTEFHFCWRWLLDFS
jgi:hypothetical protein